MRRHSRHLDLHLAARLLPILISGTTLHCGSDLPPATPPPSAQRASALMSWNEQSKLTASDAAASDAFGNATDVDADTAIVGARFADPGALVNAGAAYIYTRSGTSWMQQAKLVPMDVAANDNFGWSVAISGDTVVVGAFQADPAAGIDAGAAYVYLRSGTMWTLQQKLTAMDGATTDWYGYSVAIDGNRIAIGAPQADIGGAANAGATYVYDRSGTTWTQTAKLAASDSANGDRLGWAVAVEGAIVAVGCPEDNPAAGTDAGAGYIYEQVSGTFMETKLTAADGATMDKLGTSVALASGTAIFGAPYADVSAKGDAGAAYVYTRQNVGTWPQQAKLITPAADTTASDFFGNSVALVGNLAVVGATGSDPSAKMNAGAAYAYTRSGTTWTQTTKLVASDAAPNDAFGLVAMSRNTTLIGSLGADLPAKADAGAAYVYISSSANGDACAMAFECGSGFCVDGVCCNAACGGGLATDCLSCVKAQTGLTGDGACGTITSSAAYTCRTPATGCDAPEICDGTSSVCPMDKNSPSGTVCRSAVGGCDAVETCDGTSAVCPLDKYSAIGTVCRAAVSVCDLVETCDGIGPACPVDGVRAAGTMCRPAIGVCDVAETCNGSSGACPVDLLKPAGVVCLPAGTDATCDPADTCDGARRTCAARYAPRSTLCAGGLSCNGIGRCG